MRSRSKKSAARRPSSEPPAPPPHQSVVVRSPGSSVFPPPAPESRRRCPTLPGLGFRSEFESLPLLGPPENEVSPVSEVRARVAPRVEPPKPEARDAGEETPSVKPLRLRPTVVLEADAELAKRWLADAERLLALGIFKQNDSTERSEFQGDRAEGERGAGTPPKTN